MSISRRSYLAYLILIAFFALALRQSINRPNKIKGEPVVQIFSSKGLVSR